MARTKGKAPGTAPNYDQVGRRKRARLDSGDPEVHENSQTQRIELQGTATSAAKAVLSWAATVSRIETEEMSSQIQRYKFWKRE